jgi:diguanylate cyclase (GGDEF)-like protein
MGDRIVTTDFRGPEGGDDTLTFEKGPQQQETAATHEPFLMQVSGEDTGRMFRLLRGETIVGRAPECGIAVNDPHASRNHAAIRRTEADVVTIRDLGSSNGLFVNGVKVAERTLKDGDRIQIGGGTCFKFCLQTSAEEQFQQGLLQAATVDELTGLYNRKYFTQTLAREFSASRRSRQPLSLMMIDVDHFKRINDKHGHLAGDQVLRTLGQLLQQHLRSENAACRYGGEEFAVILRNTDGAQAHTAAERVRKEIAAAPVAFRDKTIPVTASIGIATLAGDNFATAEELVRAADGNLYRAKNRGRNCTVSSVSADTRLQTATPPAKPGSGAPG